MDWVTIPGLELAKVGEWDALTGKWHCTEGQIAGAVKAYSSGRFRDPVIKLGHLDPRFKPNPSHDGEPAMGRFSNLRASGDGKVLLGDATVPSWLAKDMPYAYPSRSIEAKKGVRTHDGEEFELVVTNVALLGVTPPAIQDLGGLQQQLAGESTEYVAASTICASMEEPLLNDEHPDLTDDLHAEGEIAAAAWNESLHPRQGGKFVAKGSGYKTPAKVGAKGGDKSDQAGTVKALQQELVRLGLLSPDSGANGGVDGKLGPKTEAAVKAWQKRAGLKETGRVTPALLSTLKSAKKSSDPKKLTERRKALRKVGKLPAPPKRPTAAKAAAAKATSAVKTAVAKKAVAARRAQKKPAAAKVSSKPPKRPVPKSSR